MKIFHVVHWPRSGIGVLLRDLVSHRSPGVEHFVMCLAPGQPVTDQIRSAGGTVYEPDHSLSWTRCLRMLRTLIQTQRPDVIHSHSLTPRVLTAIGVTSVRHMTTVHAAYVYFHQRGFRSAMKRALECVAARGLSGPCVCVSEDVARSLSCERMKSRAFVIVNGIDLDRVRDGANEPGPSLTGNPLLVAVGRLDWEKGFNRLLRAVAAVRSQLPHLRLVICGSGVEREALEEQARDLSLGDVVTFAGHVANPMPYLRVADAFVSSSIQEGFALTAAEAMALGRPVIATPASGVRSALRDGQTAIIAAGFEPDDIGDAILRAFVDRERLRHIAAAGCRFAVENLDVRRAVSAYERTYRDLAASGRLPTSLPR